ncbi:hypothetical protein [Spiroplasma endosymbiont of Calodromius spilotus]|uniref:hypothetical protein n=1 Tax=Spiroplasma endosymbiont of Calodromius spilotus TaxID=3077929 RepID=UPI0031FECDF4
MFLVAWKDLDWEMTKLYFWDLFIQITTIPAHITGSKEIKLTEAPLWLLIANIAFWLLTAIMVWFILMLLWKTISVFR